jgi:pyridoxal phosphate enzyme (YggS family)
MAELEVDALARRLAAVRERIARAASAVGRDTSEVRIVAVTKTHPLETVRAALAVGLVDLGENRAEDLMRRSESIPARWHMVGGLQRNKVRHVVGRAALIHSVDRTALVDAVARHAETQGLVQDVLLQANVGDDPAKGGCSLADLPGLVSYAAGAPGVRVRGLMTVPPLPSAHVAPSESARPHFRVLREVRDALRSEHPTLEELSMGMSDDLEAAVQEGATMVRIGSALFGARGEVVR